MLILVSVQRLSTKTGYKFSIFDCGLYKSRGVLNSFLYLQQKNDREN